MWRSWTLLCGWVPWLAEEAGQIDQALEHLPPVIETGSSQYGRSPLMSTLRGFTRAKT
jgi:hypothetical protein